MTDELYYIEIPMGCISETDWSSMYNPERDVKMALYHDEAKAIYRQFQAIFEAGDYPIAPYSDKDQLNLNDFPDLDDWAESLTDNEFEDFFDQAGK